ncbi:hypothetical protein [Roseateles puraquae]|uniref:Uncharacterized protein n=1 Tax=Roseateles puraquae TaxID=431059 RepID=A0A254N127_9BURK|nr:hypothetical protein [Roseateles puraquae]MDG0856314.1 hypothetical protein [Roseateles puraquae]OWR01975.1 hypothetical protein CDO81_21840 [Roseateles puraquae]
MSTPSRLHLQRLRQLWRSAGWPCQDLVEVELLAAGWVERLLEADGRERLRLTDAGIAHIAASLNRNRAARDAHEQLVERVATEMQRAGRIAWRGLSLRAGLPPAEGDDGGKTVWVNAMPDVYSIRHSTVEDYLEPAIHEIKVSRADLLGELRRPAKSAAYRALCGQCWFVIKAGIAEPDEIPPEYGVFIGHETHLELARPAPRRACKPDFATWMALARATPLLPPEDPQGQLA